MRKALVTGASGFVGYYVVEELLRNNFSVIVTSSNLKRIEHKSWFNSVKYIPFNLKDQANIDYFSYFDRPDLMIHLAWEGLPNYKSLFHFEENLPRHYSLLKNMVSNGLTDLTVTGTCFEYGFNEGCLREIDCTNPANPYAIAKDTLQKFLLQLQTIHPFSFKWARLFYMYGQGQNPKSLFSQLDSALEAGQDVFNMSGGEQLRDYLTVEKVAEYIVAIAAQTKVAGIINCCSGFPVQLKKLVNQYLFDKNQSIKLNLGYYPYPDYEPMAFWGDNSKLKTIIN